MSYREFNNTKPSDFYGVNVPIVAMRSISDMDVWFYMCSFPDNMKVRFALNFIPWGAKDWWILVSKALSPTKLATLTLEQFTYMSRSYYHPLMERSM